LLATVLVGIDEGVVIAVFGAVVKGEPGVRESGGFTSLGLFDKGASLIAPNSGDKFSLLAMVSLDYVGDKNSPPLRVPLRGKG